MNSEQKPKYIKKYYTEVEVERMAQKLNAKVVYKKEHTKVFKPKRSCSSNKKLGEYVDDYPLDKYLIKNSAKIICYMQVNKNLYAIIKEKGISE